MLRSAVSRTGIKTVGQAGGGSSSHADGMHPNLGLHNAAATGNIGLVKFALENGQPANSNLNGILPLHAACSGGSEQSVRMLIFHGADVNAARLKVKGSTGPGAEGSTPLHFAAANGHLDIVRILLEAGALPAAADKDGVVAEALALGNGHDECANLIRSWISAYGSKGLAGMVESRDTVSGDVTLGPIGYIRYQGRSESPLSSNTAPKAGPSSTAPISNAVAASSSVRSASFSSATQLPAATSTSSRLKIQYSSDTLTASGYSRQAAPASSASTLSKPSSNPNLRSQSFSTAPPLSMPAAPLSTSKSQATGASGSNSNMSTCEYQDPTGAPRSVSTSSASGTSLNGAAGSSAAGSVRESKRRPSLPSIIEKAAHPAASLRAALGGGSSAHHAASTSQTSSSRYLDQSYDSGISSPGKKYNKLGGKRSFSNILRKATSSTPSSNQNSTFSSMQGSTSSFFADASAASSSSMLSGGTINLDALAKPGRAPAKSFDYQRPSASMRALRRKASESSSDDHETRKGTSTSSQQMASSRTPFATSRSDAAAIGQHRELRSTSSHSSLSAAASTTDGQVRRSRAGSNDRIVNQADPRVSQRGNGSLDLLRPGNYSRGEDSRFMADREKSEGNTASDSQNNRIDATKRTAAGQSLMAEAYGNRPRGTSAAPYMTGRGRSVSGSSSRSETEQSYPGSTVEETADDEDDLQEFLHKSVSEPGDRTLDAKNTDDRHALPANLRNMTVLRKQSSRDAGDSSATEIAYSNSALPNPNALSADGMRPNAALDSRSTRDRSGSHVSAVSSGSLSGNSGRGTASGSFETGARSSPSLAASYQALSIAEENGLASPTGYNQGAGNSIPGRVGRATSVTESIQSHASTSSLRSNYLSAAEQAQAILNQDVPFVSDAPDGTSTTLAAQLAAYGEALALERMRAGNARSGPSPSLSARNSNAALRSKLPSVSEDQSPSRTAGHSARSFSVSENRAPNYPATAAQSYNRRVSRRPHSSEGRQSQDNGGKRGMLGSGNMTIGHSTLSANDRTRLGLDRSPGLSTTGQGKWPPAHFATDSERAVSPNPGGARNLGSPLHSQPTSDWAPSEQHAKLADSEGTARMAAAAACSEGGAQTAASKSQPPLRPRRRHQPVVLSATTGMRSRSDSSGDDQAPEVGHETEDDPKTPVIGSSSTEKFATSPRSLHRHSPSMPTELTSYASARTERADGTGFVDSGDGSTASLTPPVAPPRKESIVAVGFEDPAVAHLSSDSRMLTPDSAMWSTWRNAGGASGEEDLSRENLKSSASSRWENIRRPSLNMLRNATSSSTHSSHAHSRASHGGTDEHGHGRWSTDENSSGVGESSNKTSTSSPNPAGGGKRRLVRNLINKAKGAS